MNKFLNLFLILTVSGICGFGLANSHTGTKPRASHDIPGEVDNMHHFMEYISLPSYQQLKSSLQSEPTERSGWVPIKSSALILAETSNLVMMRAPEENAEQWKKISGTVYDEASALYQAARKSDFALAKKHYATMIDNCNQCHQKFADGEYQLEK